MKDERTGAIREYNAQTDWERLRDRSDADIRAAIEQDADAIPTDEAFWKSAKVVSPHRKEIVTMRLDANVLAWFRQKDNYQVRINAALQDYVRAHAGV